MYCEKQAKPKKDCVKHKQITILINSKYGENVMVTTRYKKSWLQVPSGPMVHQQWYWSSSWNAKREFSFFLRYTILELGWINDMDQMLISVTDPLVCDPTQNIVNRMKFDAYK